MQLGKYKKISNSLSKSLEDILREMYLDLNMSSIEIVNYFDIHLGIKITARSIQTKLKQYGLTRSPSDRFKLAIKKGRMDYAPRRKKIKSSELRKGITLKLRYEIFARDNFRCVLCGKTGQEELLVVDHIKPVTYGGDNQSANLRVLCRACNLGKKLYENEK
ncbi:MAG: hypothetical protein UT02_C0007G0009 [Parcubacteria group bacterium GW2011_GWC2_38_7]|nr:MAG: hypothetical protein UT02_C0007G0009 [Parcubacteria group bacterium GW2011_GWC2_38_7]